MVATLTDNDRFDICGTAHAGVILRAKGPPHDLFEMLHGAGEVAVLCKLAPSDWWMARGYRIMSRGRLRVAWGQAVQAVTEIARARGPVPDAVLMELRLQRRARRRAVRALERMVAVSAS
jgi:hypothetical protein